jgi:hypothetical protein
MHGVLADVGSLIQVKLPLHLLSAFRGGVSPHNAHWLHDEHMIELCLAPTTLAPAPATANHPTTRCHLFTQG